MYVTDAGESGSFGVLLPSLFLFSSSKKWKVEPHGALKATDAVFDSLCWPWALYSELQAHAEE
jgi:hypothetical protein